MKRNYARTQCRFLTKKSNPAYFHYHFFLFFYLDVSKDEPYFWIDDMFVTGVLASKVPHEIKIYNWKNSFLSDHRSVFSIKLIHSFDSHFES
jgi:hypothetical protein